MSENVDRKSVSREEMDMENNDNASGSPPRIFIPDVLANWPWTRQIHPDCAEIEKETAVWLAGLPMFSPRAQDAYNRCKYTLFTCLLYPNLSKEGLRRVEGFYQFGWMLDEYMEKSTPSEVDNQKDIMMDAFRNSHEPRPKGEWIGGEMARQLWEKNMKDTTEVWQKRFIKEMHGWVEGLQKESIVRYHNHILDFETFLRNRTHAGGVELAIAPIQLDLDILDEVKSHPAIREMTVVAGQICLLCNDILSYNVEQMRGEEVYNSITCVMNEYNTDVNGAILWVQDYISGLIARFFAIMKSLPQWEEPIKSQVKKYCDGLGLLVRGKWEWCFESEKYLGNKGSEIKKTKWMSLLPRKLVGKEIGPVHVDGSLL